MKIRKLFNRAHTGLQVYVEDLDTVANPDGNLFDLLDANLEAKWLENMR